MNELIIIGNLTNDPVSRAVDTRAGQRTVCTFTVAANKGNRGEKAADFFRVSCRDRQADNAMRYLKKGAKVAVRGAVTAQAYIGGDGQARAAMAVTADRIEYLSTGRTGGTGAGDSEAGTPPTPEDFTPIDDDELPF